MESLGKLDERYREPPLEPPALKQEESRIQALLERGDSLTARITEMGWELEEIAATVAEYGYCPQWARRAGG